MNEIIFQVERKAKRSEDWFVEVECRDLKSAKAFVKEVGAGDYRIVEVSIQRKIFDFLHPDH